MKKILYLLASIYLALSVFSCAKSQQKLADSMSNQLQVHYQVISNHANEHGLDGSAMGAEWASVNTAIISINNTGKEILSKDWVIYFSSIRRILKTDNDQFEIKRITGDLHQITPTDKFAGFPANAKVDIPIVGEYWQLFVTDVLPRWFVVAKGSKPRIIKNTDTEDISTFVSGFDKNWKRTAEDQNILMTPVSRFAKNASVQNLDNAQLRGQIIPTPVSLEVFQENIDLSKGISFPEPSLTEESLSAAKATAQSLGLKILNSGYPIITQIIPENFDSGMQISGAYTLKIEPEKATVVGYDDAGALYGLQSIFSLVTPGNLMIPALSAYDAPRYAYRGMHLDIARNFHSKESILRLLEVMGRYKLNKFHFHLSDDEGWRIEIPGLPELTKVGAKRSFDLSETTSLITQLGAGPFAKEGEYLTRADYIEILKYAKARHIEVIPEIDMPAHMRAGVISMEARYNKLAKQGKMKEAEEYRLMDPEDTSNITTTQFYDRRSHMNPALESSKRFVEKVITEIQAMHKEANMPLETWHYGGDETKNIMLAAGFQDINATPKDPGKGIIDQSLQDKPFAKSPAAQKLINAGVIKDLDELPSYFAVEVSKILKKLGISKLQAWQDGVSHVENAQALATGAGAVNFWETLYWGGFDVAPDWSAKGFDVVLSSPDYLYFDFPNEVNPMESGYYWGTRYTDERKLFAFAPSNLPQNAETSVDRDGAFFTAKGTKQWAGPQGIQAQLWSEVLRTDDAMEYMIYPRIISLAERAWHEATWELPYTLNREFTGGKTTYVNQALLNQQWQVFANLIGQRELKKFNEMGIHYRLPVPGAKIENGTLVMNIALPGIQMHYSKDGQKWEVYQEPIALGQNQVFIRSTSDGKRFSRVEKVEAV